MVLLLAEKRDNPVLRIIYTILPLLEHLVKNHKIDESLKYRIDNYCKSELPQSIKEKSGKALLEEYKFSLQVKDKLEDKAKINALAVTIVCTLIMGSSSAISGAFKNSSALWLPIVAAIVFIIAVLYMVVAAFTAFWLIAENNTAYYFSAKSEDLDTELQRECYETTVLNNLTNVKRNNFVVTSFSCVRIALLSLFLVMMLMLSPIIIQPTNPAQQQTVSHQSGQLFFSSQAITYIESNGNRQTIESLILQSHKDGKISVNNPVGLIDNAQNLFVKVELNYDGSIIIMQIEPFVSP